MLNVGEQEKRRKQQVVRSLGVNVGHRGEGSWRNVVHESSELEVHKSRCCARLISLVAAFWSLSPENGYAVV